jgi:hypothetical protein
MSLDYEAAEQEARAQARKHRRKQEDGKPNRAARSMGYTLLRDLKPNLTVNDIVKDLIPRNAFVEAHAVSGGGKTAIIVDLGLHVADGRNYRERRVQRQPVIYVALEGFHGIENRIIAAAAELGIEDAPFALVKTSDNFRDTTASEKIAAIAKQMLADFGGDCPVIVIDTYTAALGAGGSDCDPKDVSAFIENIKKNLLSIGCTVIINHHFGKDASRGGRGWSGLNAALDVELEIDRDEDLRTMRVTKARDGSDSQPAFCYQFRSRQLGVDNYGDPVCAVVVEHLADEDTAKRGKRFSPKARAAFNKLWEMIKTPAESFPLPDHPGLRCVILADWERACIAPGTISQANAEKERRYKFNAAKKELEDAGAIVLDRDRVYPTPKSAGDGGDDSEI